MEQKFINSELLAILINTGRHGFSSLDIANELLISFNGLKELKHLSINDLTTIKRIGLYKAVILKAAFELGERMYARDFNEKLK